MQQQRRENTHRVVVLLVFFNVLLVHKVFCADGAANETLQVYTEDEKSCRGPGSDPYRNFVFNGRCNCKKNVRGIFCTECKRNSFDLSARHQKGCLRCFCSGISSSCASSNWYRDKIFLSFVNNSQGIELVYKNLSVVPFPIHVDNESEAIYADNLSLESKETYYWKLPYSFLGERLTAYGGFLNFTLDHVSHHPHSNSSYSAPRKWLKDPLVIMEGNGLTIYYRFRKRDRGIKSHFLPIVEQSWFKLNKKPTKKTRRNVKNERKRRRAKRKDVMSILSNVEYILVKAKFRTRTSEVRLLSISMSHAVPKADPGVSASTRTTEIEMCDCPPGYSGLSCQYCSSGYTRAGVATSRRKKHKQCFPCNCNGHSDSCHHDTGVCLNCQHNTGGDHCQHSLLACDPSGTFKHEILPHVHSRCVCKSRLQGELCDTCKLGFFNLNENNDKGCKKCWCSGVTFKCDSSKLRRFQLRIQPPAFINVGFFDGVKQRLRANKVVSGKAIFHFKKYNHFSDYHWSLPKTFTGNLLKSYGGSLNFSLYNDGICDDSSQPRSFLELESFEGEIMGWRFNPPVKMKVLVTFSIRFSEEHFLYYGFPTERSVFLRILSSLKSIRIYVPDCPGIKSSEISNVVLDTAVDWASKHPEASEVEHCQCPHQYSGLSCENCSPGFVKDASRRRCVRKSVYS